MNVNKTIQLALEYYRTGKLQLAERTFRKILSIQKNNADAFYYLGNILYDTRRLEEAISCYDRALELNPNFAGTHYNLGSIFLEKEKLDNAIYHLQKALQLDPNCPDIYNTLGVIFERKNQFDEAIMHYQKALQLNPNFSTAYYNLGNIFYKKGDFNKALDYYQKALQFNPNYAKAYNGIGNILKIKGQLHDAINCYQKAIELNSNNAGVHCNLGNVYREKGQMNNAIVCYQKAIHLNSGLIEAHWAHCFSQIPIYYINSNNIETCRARYHEELIKLQKIISLNNPEDIEAASRLVGSQQPFYLAYQGYNDRDLQQIYGRFVCKIMALRYPQWALSTLLSFIPGEPLKIGIVSGYFHYHSNWKIPIKGWIENIDKQRFSLFGYYTGKKKDKETEAARKFFNHFIEDIDSFEDLCKIIQNDNLHILVFPEIGMDPMTIRLAAITSRAYSVHFMGTS